MNCTKSCGAIVFRSKILENSIDKEDLEILLVRYGTHHWGFPKGQMEEGETEEDTAIREIKEETLVDVIIDTKFRVPSSYSTKSGLIKENIFFLAEPTNPNATVIPQLSEVSDAKWFNISNIKPLITFADDYDLFLKALSFWKDRKV